MRFAIACLIATGCGTYSMVRPAHTLPRGKVEIALGLAASGLEVNTIAHAAVGVTDRIEILGQNEVWNTFGELRYAVRTREDGPVQVVLGAGGGYALTLISASSDDGVTGAAGTVSVAVGHDWGRLSLAIGNRSFFLAAGYLASSTRAGLRVRALGRLGLLVEGGATVHAPLEALGLSVLIGEGSLGLFVDF